MANRKPMTHIVLKKRLTAGMQNNGLIKIRETSRYWVDEYGNKYCKKSGWEIGRYSNYKICLNTMSTISEDNK